MKKLMIAFSIGLLLMACTKETTVIVVEENPPANNDLDGDGVKNIIEEIDGTDAHDGCKYLESSQNYNLTTEEWRNTDCDGDGVINGRELDPDGDGAVGPDNTNPKFECDFTLAHQNYGITTPVWRMLDCDGDGVTNGNEVDPDGNNSNNGNGTDPLDDCDLVISLQTLEPSQSWLEKDCDEDCVSNEQELLENTDPLNGDDYLGNGDLLTEFREVWNYSPEEIHYFDQGGNRLVQIVDSDGLVLSDYTYDGENLMSAQIRTNSGTLINFSYEYQNDQVSQITRDGMIRTIEYQGNSILTHDSGEPAGLYREKLSFDGNNDNLLTKERFYLDGSTWVRQLFEYSYNGNTISGYVSGIEGYDPSTGQFFEIDPDDFNTAYASFIFSSSIRNPIYTATQRLRTQILFDPDLISRLNQTNDAVNAHFEPSHLDRFTWGTQYVDYAYTLSIGCTNGNNDPTRGDWLGIYGDDYGDLVYIYE